MRNQDVIQRGNETPHKEEHNEEDESGAETFSLGHGQPR